MVSALRMFKVYPPCLLLSQNGGICAHFVASKRGENEVLINGVD